MRYDGRYGRHGGWEMRMEHGDHGYDRGYRDPRQGRGGPTERPWVGGYEPGYQGGSEGISVRTTGPLYGDRGYGRDFSEHERGYRRPRGARPVDGRGTVRMRVSGRELDTPSGRGGGYGRDYGGGYGRAYGGYGPDFGGGYDRGMRGGSRGYAREYPSGPPPRPPQDAPWTRERTRWF